MGETYMITTPNGKVLFVEKETNKIRFLKNVNPVGKYTEEYSKAVFKAYAIVQNSLYKDYKPMHLDSTLKTGESSTLLEFKSIQELYLSVPLKGSFAPWTKKEKAYYESLKTKRERYKYLVIRSGIRSAIIDIPFDAIASVDENGKLIDKKYEDLYKEVEANRNTLKSNLFFAEWNLAAGMLGDINGFWNAGELSTTGFKARSMQCEWLCMQLGNKFDMQIKNSIKDLYEVGYKYAPYRVGLYENPIRAEEIKNFSKNVPYDEFGMLPYLDELIGVDWIMDFNDENFCYDASGDAVYGVGKEIERGKLLDPRSANATPESRMQYDAKKWSYVRGTSYNYAVDISSSRDERSKDLYIDTLLLNAKIQSVTPKQGYTNAPIYYTPESMEDFYKNNAVDRLQDPRIPAIQRYNFPEYLKKEIEQYAKEHNIKEQNAHG